MDIKSTPLSEVYNILETGKAQNLSSLCKKSGKWGMYVSLGHQDGASKPGIGDYILAAPYLRHIENEPILVNGFGYFLFDHEDDMEHAFDITIGDSGPTKWNDYSGPASIYALTCNPEGVTLDENT